MQLIEIEEGTSAKPVGTEGKEVGFSNSFFLFK